MSKQEHNFKNQAPEIFPLSLKVLPMTLFSLTNNFNAISIQKLIVKFVHENLKPMHYEQKKFYRMSFHPKDTFFVSTGSRHVPDIFVQQQR